MKVFETKLGAKQGIQTVRIDDSELQFMNGMAVAVADVSVYKMDYGNFKKWKTSSFRCMCVVNEECKEAFLVNEYGSTASYLMLLEQNREILRCGANDFFVRSEYKGISGFESTHIRIIKGRPVLVNKDLGICRKTRNEQILIADNRLYDVVQMKYLTRRFKEIEEADFLEVTENDSSLFTIVDHVVIESPSGYFVSDYLNCQIDVYGNIRTPVQSYQKGYLCEDVFLMSYEELRKKHLESMLYDHQKFNMRVRALKRLDEKI